MKRKHLIWIEEMKSTRLSLVYVITRHGDRSPLMNYYAGLGSLEREDENRWKEKILLEEKAAQLQSLFPCQAVSDGSVKKGEIYGKLTNEGYSKSRELGIKLRERYKINENNYFILIN